MQVHLRFRPRRIDDQAVDVPEGATVMDVMRAAGAEVDTYVAVRAGRPIPEDATVIDGEELLLLSAASGG